MHLIRDVDALLLLAMALASKRRPAQLAEVMAAADLIHGSIPLDVDLAEAFLRLSSHGLISNDDGGFRLTPDALEIMAGLPRKKSEAAERLSAVKEKLAGHAPKGAAATITLSTEQLTAAILAHRSFLKGPGRNMLVPKPKTAVAGKPRPGQWRKPATGGRSRV
ncbi:MAG: hypothetical protein WCI19_04935 [Betaproteobacteria bacterium]|nr:hypothetical protein [Rhodocyclales bacterium]